MTRQGHRDTLANARRDVWSSDNGESSELHTSLPKFVTAADKFTVEVIIENMSHAKQNIQKHRRNK